jgi:hypothetical protein
MPVNYAEGYNEQTKEVETQIDENSVYLVDFSKITSVNDLVLIFAALGLSFSPKHPHFPVIKGFLDLENGVPVGQPTLDAKKELKMPKLKTIK